MTIRASRWCMVLLAVCPTFVFAEIDQRPMDVEVVAAFPRLEWPEWVRGLDEGLVRDPRPLLLTGAGDGTNRVFVVSQYGTVHVWPSNTSAEEMKTFLDIRPRVQYDDRENEEGFLGLAFHPRYQENGQFFVYYTAKRKSGNDPHMSIISRFRVSADDPNRADPDSEQVIMRIRQPYWNHN
ncbi:MAG: PQQ-dependent sugar dehydrogenase, partial [Pirellulales bacterium]